MSATATTERTALSSSPPLRMFVDNLDSFAEAPHGVAKPSTEQKRIVAKVDQLLSQCDELSARFRERASANQRLLAATIHRLLDDLTGS